ncbi:LysR substrate-binding domain-containing protein [Parasedimentitalea psychrophila]|uniref:LysR substrate-binding domain-containing protein n=1 Tax=Parasedimentitalea psychrophila TaxID=2997337 RepID=UPI0022EA8611|nr:LysR substrate-binding domain-containing protein [Parasedimentitalea psychrophila]
METTAASLFGGMGQTVITLQAVTLLAMSWLPARLAAFEAAHPRLRVNVICGETLADFRTILPGREPDLQIAFGSVTDFADTAEPFLHETLKVVAAPDVARSINTPGDLASHALFEVTAHRSGWHQVLSSCPNLDLRALDFRMTDSTPFALALAAQKQGLALARSPASDEIVRVLGLQYCDTLRDVRGLQRYFFLQPGGGALSRHAALLRDWLLT